MYFKRNAIGSRVFNNLAHNKKLAAVLFLLSFACILWNILNLKQIWDFYGFELCVADAMLDLQEPLRFGIMVFPFMLFFLLKCKQHSLNLQIVLRCSSRSAMFRRQLAESIIYAVVCSTFFVLLEVVISAVFLENLIDWRNTDSRFYHTTGMVSDIGFFEILLLIWLMYIVKLLLFLFFMDMLFWNPRYLFLIWPPIVFFTGVEWTEKVPVFHLLFSVEYSYAAARTTILAPFLIGVLLLAAEYLIGTMFIKKKDLLG